MRQICREVKITPGCGVGAEGWANVSIPPEQAQLSCLSVCYAVYRGNPAKITIMLQTVRNTLDGLCLFTDNGQGGEGLCSVRSAEKRFPITANSAFTAVHP